VAAVLPGRWARELAEGAGILAARAPRLAARRAMVGRHLERVAGPGLSGAQRGRMIDDAFASYARYWAESLRLPSLTAAEVDAGFSFRGIDHLEVALDGGRGAILALPHLGGWEWGGTWLARTDHPVSVVVEELQPPELFEWFAGFRRRLGMEVIPLGPGAASASMRALDANRVLCLLCDRVVGGAPGIDVDFFGERTQLPGGPVTLALRSGAPVLPAAVYFGPGTDEHLGVVRPPMALTRAGRLRDDVAAGTQLLAHELEDLIRRAPTQWHLMQPNWPSDLDVAPGTA
jgi:lauroyl/myristoyl acyltransferase